MKRLILLGLFGLLLLVAFGNYAMAQTAATLTTDKAAYAPGETAVISGAGFQPGELIDLSIAIQDPVTEAWIPDWDWGDGYCGEDGAFTAEYLVPDRALAKSLKATALGITSGLVATVGFTDDPAAETKYTAQIAPAQANAGEPTQLALTLTNIGQVIYFGKDDSKSVDPALLALAEIEVPGQWIDVTVGSVTPSTWTAAVSAPSDKPGEHTVTLQPGSGGSPLASGQSVSVVVTATSKAAADLGLDCGGGSAQYPWNTQAYVEAGKSKGFGNAIGGDPQITVVNTAECPETCSVPNSPPVITVSDLDVGKVVGCLVNGSFQTTADLPVTAFDADGDPVSLTASVGTLSGSGYSYSDALTLVGPGQVDVTVTFTAVDDPSDRNALQPDCTPAQSLKATPVTVHVKAWLVYNVVAGGFLPPMTTTRTTIFKQGSTIPVKFEITDCSGAPITIGNLPSAPNPADPGGLPLPVIDVVYQQGAVPSGDPVVTDAGTSNDDGDNFRCSDPLWIYNLQTNPNYKVGDTYKIIAYLNDGTTIEGSISIKK